MQKTKTAPLSPYVYKINSKWIKLRPETVRLLEENGEESFWYESWQELLVMTPKSQAAKAKNRQTKKLLSNKGNN